MDRSAPERPRKRHDEKAKAERRARGRAERERMHFRFTLYTPPEEIADPITHLENQRARYISRLEELLDNPATDPKLVAQCAVYLLKFSSLGRIKTDLGEAFAKLMREPDLARLSPAMLDRIIAGETVDVPELEGPRTGTVGLDAIDITPQRDDDEPE